MDTYADLWKSIFDSYQLSKRPVQLFVGFTSDAAATTKSLLVLLRVFRIAFDVHPIADYPELSKIAADTAASRIEGVDGADVYLLVGCGGTADVASLVDLDSAIVHVLDAARPHHLNNLRNPNIITWSIGQIRSEVDQFFAEQARKRRRKERRELRRGHGSDSDESGSDEEDDDYDEELVAVNWMEPGNVSPQLEEAYYSTSCGGTSSAVAVMLLAEEVNQFQASFVWNAAIGVTDLFIRMRTSRAEYQFSMGKLRDTVNQLTARQRARVLEDVSNAAAAAGGHDTSALQQVRLQVGTEQRLLLLRHWDLWHSMWHDPVVAAHFRLHHVDEGEETIRSMLARVGVSRREAETPWNQIATERRHDILRLVDEELRGEGLEDTSFPTITRAVGFAGEVSAVDACRFFTAHVAQPLKAANAADITDEAMQVSRRSNFWLGFDAMESGPHDTKFAGTISAVRALYKDVTSATATLLSQRGAIVTTRVLHYTQLSSSGATATETFHDPLRLHVLSTQLLLSLATERGRRGRGSSSAAPRPVVVTTPHPDGMKHTVLCEVAASPAGTVIPVIGAFTATLEDPSRLSTTVTHTGVDSCAATVIGRDEANHLAEAVHLRLVM